jgi:hypothetical protein
MRRRSGLFRCHDIEYFSRHMGHLYRMGGDRDMKRISLDFGGGLSQR